MQNKILRFWEEKRNKLNEYNSRDKMRLLWFLAFTQFLLNDLVTIQYFDICGDYICSSFDRCPPSVTSIYKLNTVLETAFMHSTIRR